MQESFNLQEIEALVTTRVLCDYLVDKKTLTHIERYTYRDALVACMYSIGDLFKERGLNKYFWARIRGRRLFLFYLPLNRIAMEIGIVTDGVLLRNNFRMQFVGYKGKFLPKNSNELVKILTRPKKDNYGRNTSRTR